MSIVERNSLFIKEEAVKAAKLTGVQESLLQEIERDILWYRENFLGKGKPCLMQRSQ